jgi:hypothetical protein
MIRVEMRGSRGAALIAACVVLAVASLGVPGAAWSASHRPRRQRSFSSEVTGPLLLAWSGDPAHGCAAAGLCGVSGTLQMQLGGDELSGSGGPPELMASDDAAVARVQTTAPDGSVTTCVDLVPVQFDLALQGASARVAGGLLGLGSEAPSAGRCAGPTSAQLAALTLPARRLAHGYDLSGRTSFATGPFAVSVISGVRARITFGGSGGGGGGEVVSAGGTSAPIKPRSVLMERTSVTYRITGVSGALTTNFAGLAPPECDALGACGATGRLVQSFTASGDLRFLGARITNRHVGRNRALADLRRGTMTLSDTFNEQVVHETVVESSAQTDGPPCMATNSILLAPGLPNKPHRGHAELVLSDTFDGFGGGPPDAFRTPCPGPSAQDILGPNGGALATATISDGQLGDRHLSITFQRLGTFTGSAYAGHRSGAVVMALALVRSTGGTRRVKLFPGEPLTP